MHVIPHFTPNGRLAPDRCSPLGACARSRSSSPGPETAPPYTTLATLPLLRVRQVVAVTRTAERIAAVVREDGRLVLYRSHGPGGRAIIETAPIPAHNLAPSDGFDVGIQAGPGGRPIIALQDGPRALVLDHTPDL